MKNQLDVRTVKKGRDTESIYEYPREALHEPVANGLDANGPATSFGELLCRVMTNPRSMKNRVSLRIFNIS